MAPLPPPPPPAPPPPPPMAAQSGPPKLSKNEAMDRNALLSQIRGGTKLKKPTAVNDRSSPIIDGSLRPISQTSLEHNMLYKPNLTAVQMHRTKDKAVLKTKSDILGKSSSATAGTAAKSSGGVKAVSNGPMQLGGLFAGGVPKLRSTGSKLVANGASNSVNSNNVANSVTNSSTNSSPRAGESIVRPSNTSIKASLEEKFQHNNSFLHTKTNENNGLITDKNKFHTINLSKARERANFISSEGKGQAPQVPTTANNGVAPSLPKKPPGVQRSNSQSSGRTGSSAGRRPGPPNMKPPPPPKLTNGTSAPQPPVGSKSSNVNRRRESYGDEERSNQNDSWSGRPDISAIVSNFNQQSVKPPAPPRNGNATNGFSQSPAYPPPPPPISTLPSRSNSSAVRMPQVNKTAPDIPIQPPRVQSSVRPPSGPPPPPPHRTTPNSSLYPAAPPPPPPSQTKVIPTSMRNGVSQGPPPPVRNTSISREEFASRFNTFEAIFKLPAPPPMANQNKVYPSHMQQSQRRRDPPPPPPQANGTAQNWANTHAQNMNSNNRKFSSSNPMLHIQIGSSIAQS